MSRIRAIKPGFFKDSDLYEAEKACGLPLRIAYSGLWTVADREGRFKWKPREIKVDVLPYDDIDMGAVLDALITCGKIFKYKANGFEYGFIPKFLEHQHVNKNEAPSTIPAPPENNNARARTRSARATTEKNILVPLQHHEEGNRKGKEQEGKEKEAPAVADVVASPDWLPLDAWSGFGEMRKKIRAPLTDRAAKNIIAELERLKTEGHDPGAVLDQSTANAWRGVFPLRHNGATGPPSNAAVDKMVQQWRDEAQSGDKH